MTKRTPTGFVCGISNAALNDHLVLPYKYSFLSRTKTNIKYVYAVL